MHLRLSGHGRRRPDATQARADAGHAGSAACPPAMAGPSRSNGTASGRWPSSTPAGCGSARAGARTTRRATRSSRRSPRRSSGREAILDGEIVAFDDAGHPELSAAAAAHGPVEPRRRSSSAPARRPSPTSPSTCSGSTARSLLAEPYERRRELLAELELRRARTGRRRATTSATARRCSTRFRARARGHRRQAPRHALPARRGAAREWLKVRNRRGQELVIGGWMPGEGSRGGPGRLAAGRLLGRIRGGQARRRRAVYAGGVGTGFTQEMLKRADRAARAASPRRLAVRARRGSAGQVRPARSRPRRRAGLGRARARLRGRVHRVDARGNAAPASFKGLRDDKDPREVVARALSATYSFAACRAARIRG